MSDLIKKDVFGSSSTGLTLNKGKLKSSSTPFQQRVNEAKASQPDAASLPNRLCLMLDRSSSMSGEKLELLKQAIDNFASRCNFVDTALAVETFPASLSLDLTNVAVMITTSVSTISASGNTPMRSCVQGSLEKVPMTRGIIVSDGEATDWHQHDYGTDDGEYNEKPSKADDVLDLYKKAQIPIDCVHIGDSSSGEDLLRRIAKETGGVFLKFTDVSAFSSGFGYLTPGYRAMLTSGQVSAEDIGAREIRK
jgi:Mg-chelatase subunit ChlD